MKFNKKSLIETIKARNDGKTSYQARKIAGVSIRRVDQIYGEYLKKEEVPLLRRAGRPMIPIEKWERDLVKRFYEKYRVSASTLNRIIERDEGIKMTHHRVHKIMLELGLAKKKEKFQARKIKWVRYERMHSLTAVHIDWHFTGRRWVFAVIDDASRKILALLECDSPTTDKSIEGMKLAMKHGETKQCISDRGSQFMNNMNGYSRFQEFLAKHGIQHIKCKIKHPQSNGKVEKWFDCYDKHRKAYKNIKDFLYWYNQLKPHRSLKFEILETPEQAYQRKKKEGRKYYT